MIPPSIRTWAKTVRGLTGSTTQVPTPLFLLRESWFCSSIYPFLVARWFKGSRRSGIWVYFAQYGGSLPPASNCCRHRWMKETRKIKCEGKLAWKGWVMLSLLKRKDPRRDGLLLLPLNVGVMSGIAAAILGPWGGTRLNGPFRA